MNKARKAWQEICAIDDLSKGDSPIHRMHPLLKLFVTIAYILTVVSFRKYDLTGLIVLIIYPILLYQISGIPIRVCFYKLRIVLPLVCAVGIFNPIFDRTILMNIGNVAVSGGVISMITLILKGILSLMASFLLIATTSIEAICYALRIIHVPKILTSLLLLTFRYISVLLSEVAIMTDAYHLRAPGQKGIHISAWGSFLGQLLLRSMQRANALYESMELRGFNGEFYYAEHHKVGGGEILFLILSIAFFAAARVFNIAVLLGSIFV